MKDFRRDYITQRNISWRILDFMLHLVFGYFLTAIFEFPFYYMLMQWFPDAVLPIIWPYSMITRRYLWEGNIFLRAHKNMHSFSMFLSSLLVAAFWLITAKQSLNSELFRISFFFYANWLGHLIIDSITHEGVER